MSAGNSLRLSVVLRLRGHFATRAQEVGRTYRLACAPNEGIGKTGAGGEYLDAHLAGAGIGPRVYSPVL
jgi:hypothetical protein